jgi:hypothetical protein
LLVKITYFQEFIFNFRTENCRHQLLSCLQRSLQSDHHRVAEIIFEKFGDEKNLISNDPYCVTYFKRYFNISIYLDNNNYNNNISNVKSNKERKKRALQMKNRDIYKNFLCHLLKSDGSSKESHVLPNLHDDYDCPVCFEYMCLPRKIFACHNRHLICHVCLEGLKTKECPICRDDFGKRKPKRSPEAEQKAEELKD